MILENREMHNVKDIDDVLNRADVCNMGMADGNKPYVLPLNFIFENNTVYIHCNNQGRMLKTIEKNNEVCLSFDCDREVFFRHENVACSYGMRYRSVIAFGKAILINDYDEKVKIMNSFMKKYTQRDDFTYNAPAVNNVRVLRIPLDSKTGKKYGY